MKNDPPIVLQSMSIEMKGGSHALFYVTMIVGDKLLHNVVIDCGTSTNAMPLSIMKDLGLEITRPCGNICGMDSREVKVVGLIKNLRVHLLAYLDISTIMDIVVIDIAPLLFVRVYS
jgi:hypothetical protein